MSDGWRLSGDVPETRAIDCTRREDLSRCGPLREVMNLSDDPINVQSYVYSTSQWVDLIPDVPAASRVAWRRGGLWLPSTTLIRTVSSTDPERVLTNVGVIGFGLSVIQA